MQGHFVARIQCTRCRRNCPAGTVRRWNTCRACAWCVTLPCQVAHKLGSCCCVLVPAAGRVAVLDHVGAASWSPASPVPWRSPAPVIGAQLVSALVAAAVCLSLCCCALVFGSSPCPRSLVRLHAGSPSLPATVRHCVARVLLASVRPTHASLAAAPSLFACAVSAGHHTRARSRRPLMAGEV